MLGQGFSDKPTRNLGALAYEYVAGLRMTFFLRRRLVFKMVLVITKAPVSINASWANSLWPFLYLPVNSAFIFFPWNPLSSIECSTSFNPFSGTRPQSTFKLIPEGVRLWQHLHRLPTARLPAAAGLGHLAEAWTSRIFNLVLFRWKWTYNEFIRQRRHSLFLDALLYSNKFEHSVYWSLGWCRSKQPITKERVPLQFNSLEQVERKTFGIQ